MPELEYFIVAESYSVDSDSNALSLFNVLNEVRTPTFPTTLPKLVAISCWIATPEEIAAECDSQVVIQFLSDGQDPKLFRGNFTCDRRLQHVVLEIKGVQVDHPSEFRVELQLNGEHKAWHRIFFEQLG